MKLKYTALVGAIVIAGILPSNAANLITNGNFEFGFTGFTSDYDEIFGPYPVSQPPYGVDEGEFTIYNDPSIVHSLFQPFAPPVNPYNSVNGNMMIVNGAASDEEIVWATDGPIVGLTVGEDYFFQGIVTNLHPVDGIALNPAILTYEYSYDNSTWFFLETQSLALTTSGDWQESDIGTFEAAFSSVYLRLRNDQTALSGNDFAIGLVYLDVVPVPEPGTVALVIGGGMFLTIFRRRKAVRA